jgi:fumarate hydratase subunit beta
MTVYKFKTPISEEEIRKLRINDTIYLSGTIFTARDEAHKRALELFNQGKKLPVNLEGQAIFHSGPLMKKEGDLWHVVAAGPTTSSRMDVFEDQFIKNFKVRIIIGKGGMGKKIANAMRMHGAVYGAFTGGAAVLAAKAIKQVKGVEWFDLGMPEAMWIFVVENFGPITVAIDTHGNNLFENVQMVAEKNKKKIYRKLGI